MGRGHGGEREGGEGGGEGTMNLFGGRGGRGGLCLGWKGQ